MRPSANPISGTIMWNRSGLTASSLKKSACPSSLKTENSPDGETTSSPVTVSAAKTTPNPSSSLPLFFREKKAWQKKACSGGDAYGIDQPAQGGPAAPLRIPPHFWPVRHTGFIRHSNCQLSLSARHTKRPTGLTCRTGPTQVPHQRYTRANAAIQSLYCQHVSQGSFATVTANQASLRGAPGVRQV